VRADAGETPAMTQARAWILATSLARERWQSQPADLSLEMAIARRRVCERFLGCRYPLPEK
jgi:hypothetical protein